MKVWLVWAESGEYENYSRGLQGVFSTSELAGAHAHEAGSEVEEWDVLDMLPLEVTLYTWADLVAPDGSLSPDWRTFKRFGRRRQSWQAWSHQETAAAVGKIEPWNQFKSLYVKVNGIDKEAVKAEYKRLIAEARAKIGGAA